MVDVNGGKTPEQIMQDKQIEDLENEIEGLKIAFEMKQLALEGLQLSTALKKTWRKLTPSVLLGKM